MVVAAVLLLIGVVSAASGSKRRRPADTTDIACSSGVRLDYPGQEPVFEIDLGHEIGTTELPARRRRQQCSDESFAEWPRPGPASPHGGSVEDAESLLWSHCPCLDVFKCAVCMAGLYGTADDPDLYDGNDGYSANEMLQLVRAQTLNLLSRDYIAEQHDIGRVAAIGSSSLRTRSQSRCFYGNRIIHRNSDL
jgi:hypothetical protein